MNTLYYSSMAPRAPITLDLFEAEKYEPAIVVQQLIGNLVYYSNHGRYEPRIAEAWEKVSENQWRFKLRRGFICENGEKITPVSFKKSLMRSFKISAKKGGVPVFDKLIGFEEFADNKNYDVPDLSVESDTLSFHFSKPTRSGPLKLLSFAQ